jgi:hypothetical protein
VTRRLRPPLAACFASLVLSLVAAGCAQSRTVVISTRPPDALIRVGGVDRGRGRVVQKFEFNSPGQVHQVVASRPGYQDEEALVTIDTPPEPVLTLTLRPLTKRVTINVSPVPAYVSIDGKPVSPDLVSLVAPDVPFTLDARGLWLPHTVSAERKGWQTAARQITWNERGSIQVDLKLEPLKKDLNVTTNPAGAQIFLDGQTLGASPIHFSGYAFPVDPDSGQFIPHRLRVTMPGYDDVDQQIGWDDGKTDYSVDLTAKSKSIRVVTAPPGATVKINGQELQHDATGASVLSRLEFPPVDDAGNLKKYTATVSKAPGGDQVWETKQVEIGWDAGRKDYKVELKEVLTRQVPLVRWRPRRAGGGWKMAAETVQTTGLKETGEGQPRRGAAAPFRVMRAPQEWSIDSFAVSPDGSQLAVALVTVATDGSLKAKIELIGTDGSPVSTFAADPAAVELTPWFSPDGSRIVFSSDRGGGNARKLNAWSAPLAPIAAGAAPAPAATRLTDDAAGVLWPSLDSQPKPRVFYQALLAGKSEPQLFSVRVDGTGKADLGEPGASQPRVSPKGDTVIFTRPDAKAGKRDVFQVPDEGGPTLNLTQTPDADECDAVWSPDGGAIALASDGAAGEDGRRNYDVWIIDMKNPARPRRVTINGSHDDCPGWSPLGDAIYFRSNRGGAWGIWKVELK